MLNQCLRLFLVRPEQLSDDSSDIRDNLINFWINAPSDLLEAFWRLSIGETTLNYIRILKPDHQFTDEQIALRNEIGNYFSENGLSSPISPNLMLANFLLSPPGLLQLII